MNMTPEEKADWLDACIALMDDEPIEFRSLLTGQWMPATHIAAGRSHRRKPATPAPAPKLAPLGPDDLLGCVLREADEIGQIAIQSANKDGIVAENKFQTFNALQYNKWEYHRIGEVEDGRPVWRRCEK